MTDSLDTLAIHGGLEPDPLTGAMLMPVHQSTTYRQSGIGMHRGFTYSRADNPTVAALERALGALEDALPAVAYSSGMAAVTGVLTSVLSAGDHVLCGDVVYGGTVRALREVYAKFGVETTFVDLTDLDAVRAALRPTTRVVVLETPANPTLQVVDIAEVAALARQAGALSVVDNTFLTPVLQRPLDLGADLSLTSTTKFIEGHNATLGGAVLTRDPDLRERLAFFRKTAGSIQTPWEAWLTLRGLKTLPLRLRASSARALLLARFLEAHPEVSRVLYPELDSHPQREVALRQQAGGGGILAFELRGGVEAARGFVASLRLVSLAENLGAVETLITHPATMTHADVPRDQRERTGLTDGLLRLSVGLEQPEDLIADLTQALESVEASYV